MNWKEVWETTKYIPSVFVGILMLASFPLVIIALSYPSILFSKYLRGRKSLLLIVKIILVTLISFLNFIAAAVLYELFIVAPIDVAYGRGVMNLLFIGLGFPTMFGVLFRNVWLVTNRNYLKKTIDKLLPD
jgi:hypothetical protein